MEYDLIIIGAGPSCLGLAQCCCKINKKILIIDRESSIGGCHRVRRVNKLFTEHGPRVYSETYKTFQTLLKDMNVNFYDLFTKYNFNLTEIGGQTVFSTLSYIELLKFAFSFFILTFNRNHGTDIMLYDYLINNKFNKTSIDMIDRVCRLTDGGGSDKFTLNEFLQLFNQQFFYKLYQPKLPNDVSLFKIWKNYLDKKNVDFIFDVKNLKLNVNEKGDNINSILINNETYYSKNFVIATPPLNLNRIMVESNLSHNWGDLSKFANDTKYIEYISITFHWDKILNLKKVYGFPRSYWGIAFIKLSDYSNFNEMNSQTVISAAITISDVVSPRIGKTANQCTESELLIEVFEQLKESYGDILKPKISILSPGVKYSQEESRWISIDTAFITSSIQKFLPFQNKLIPNLYNLGTHNGKSLYKFTSLESAVSNGVYLSKVIYPELKFSNESIAISKSYTLTDILNIIILIITLYILYKVLII